MADEAKDVADHLVYSVRTASGEGMTREQFIGAAGIFWDSWHPASEFSAHVESQSEPLGQGRTVPIPGHVKVLN